MVANPPQEGERFRSSPIDITTTTAEDKGLVPRGEAE